MCGINGFNFQDKKLLSKMNNLLKHRGPDAEGVFVNKQVSLGHRRLSILDLRSEGNQPMTYVHNRKTVMIVFNGEIYNFQEIKSELEGKGYKFKTATDTEVILASYLEWGKRCVEKFNGMWAFCIYDLQKNILFLSRDRVGKKPLHYFFDGKKFIFSSEIRPILIHLKKTKLVKESIDLYLGLGFIPAPNTIYEDIFKLEARQNLIFNLETKKLIKEYYYDWPDYDPSLSRKLSISEGNRLISESVKKRLVSDVPLGAFLSGGLDSSTIVSEMTKSIPKEKLITFSIGFDGKYDETKYITLLKNHLGVQNNHRYFTEKEFSRILRNIFYNFDEPFADPSMFPSTFLSEFTKEKLTVSLSGDGGDEVFGGYPRYKMAKQMDLMRVLPEGVRRLIFKLNLSSKLNEGLRLSLLPKEDFYSEARENIYKPKVVKDLLRKTLKNCLQKTKGNLSEAIRLMDIYLYTLPENYLTKVDRSSMINSLEVRCPFLDYRLIEYSMSVPSKYKVGLFRDKVLFREMIKDKLPKSILNRKKQGFTPPIIEYLENPFYRKELKRGLNALYKKGIISQEWHNFFNSSLGKKDLISMNYKLRLFLLICWLKYWKK